MSDVDSRFSAKQETQMLDWIIHRVQKLSPAGRRWLLQRLTAVEAREATCGVRDLGFVNGWYRDCYRTDIHGPRQHAWGPWTSLADGAEVAS